MQDGSTAVEGQFIASLPTIERAVAAFGRRYGMSADDTEELASAIKLRIIENDYAVFRKFRGESSLAAYVTVVVTMLAREERVAERGRWRPSAAAVRQGPVAVSIETLVHQKGYPLAEAGNVMRSRGETTLTDRELGDLLRELPRRGPMRPVRLGDDSLRSAPSADDAEQGVIATEKSARRASVEKLLSETMGTLPTEDRLLLKLRFWQEASVADAARILGTDQRPLYRKLEKLLGDLRARLAENGVSAEEVRELIGDQA